MKYRLLIALVALAPTLVLADGSILVPTQSISSGKPAGMPPAPTSQTVQNTVKAVETVSGATSATPTPSSEKSSGKSGGSSMKSTYNYNECNKYGTVC